MAGGAEGTLKKRSLRAIGGKISLSSVSLLFSASTKSNRIGGKTYQWRCCCFSDDDGIANTSKSNQRDLPVVSNIKYVFFAHWELQFAVVFTATGLALRRNGIRSGGGVWPPPSG